MSPKRPALSASKPRKATGGILVALDGSPFAESVLTHVRSVARTLDRSLHLLAVLDPARSGATARSSAECRLELLELESYLRQVEADLREDGFEVSVEVREGEPAEEIVAATVERRSPLVALAARPRREGDHLRSRGVAQRVIASGTASVLVARGSARRRGREAAEPAAPGARSPSREGGYRRLAAAVDGSKASHGALRLAAALIGEESPGTLLLIHVAPPESPPRRAGTRYRWSGPRRRITAVDPSRSRRYLDRLERAVAGSGLRVRTALRRSSDVAGAVEEEATEAGAELLVLGAHGAGAAAGRYGRCSRSLLIHGDLPLLVVQDAPGEDRRPERAGPRRDVLRRPRRRSARERPNEHR